MGIKDTQMFAAAAERAFKELEPDRRGKVDFKDVSIGILKVYDRVNASLPLGVHVPAPHRRDMMALCRRFDDDGDGRIDASEFKEIAGVMFGTREAWRESLPWIVFSTVALNLVVYPLLAALLVSAVEAQTKDSISLPQAPVAAALSFLLPMLLRPTPR